MVKSLHHISATNVPFPPDAQLPRFQLHGISRVFDYGKKKSVSQNISVGQWPSLGPLNIRQNYQLVYIERIIGNIGFCNATPELNSRISHICFHRV